MMQQKFSDKLPQMEDAKNSSMSSRFFIDKKKKIKLNFSIWSVNIC